MSHDLTPRQALLIFGLLARHGESAQKDLHDVKKADRIALVTARLIGATRSRGFYLTLTDAGWAWAAAHLSAELPSNQRALHDLLDRIGDHLKRSSETLADFIGSKPPNPQAVKPEPKKKSVKASPKRRKLSPADVRKKIEQAYSDITSGKTSKDVLLAELRPRLPEIDQSTFDAALEEMHLEGGKARLLRIDNNRALTEADKQAAFHFKGNIFHVLWIES